LAEDLLPRHARIAIKAASNAISSGSSAPPPAPLARARLTTRTSAVPCFTRDSKSLSSVRRPGRHRQAPATQASVQRLLDLLFDRFLGAPVAGAASAKKARKSK
jgi:hypothetical protein